MATEKMQDQPQILAAEKMQDSPLIDTDRFWNREAIGKTGYGRRENAEISHWWTRMNCPAEMGKRQPKVMEAFTKRLFSVSRH